MQDFFAQPLQEGIGVFEKNSSILRSTTEHKQKACRKTASNRKSKLIKIIYKYVKPNNLPAISLFIKIKTKKLKTGGVFKKINCQK